MAFQVAKVRVKSDLRYIPTTDVIPVKWEQPWIFGIFLQWPYIKKWQNKEKM